MKEQLTQCVQAAIQKTFGLERDPLIRLATRPEHGDYQANFALRLAKERQQNPMDIVKAVIGNLNNPEWFQLVEASPPGFINIFLSNTFLSQSLQHLVKDPRLGVSPKTKPETVVVDYANANVAKEMHVGHIRSIVIGDAIVRLLNFLGDHTLKQSHLGDWGTQFGMLIEYLIETNAHQQEHSVTDLDVLYKKSKQRFDADAAFADKARQRVVALQRGDEKTLAIWRHLVKESLQYFQKIYDTLDVSLTENDARGESFYNFMLADLTNALEKKGVVTISEGAKVMALDAFSIPFIVQKKDGGYLYATTDLAAATFRVDTLKATRLIYLTDARQKQHFAMLFAALRKADLIDNPVRLEHIPFGTILGPDNKPFKTRSGESIRLITLLEEAQSRALKTVKEKNTALTEAQQQEVAHAIGIGALKYADLRTDKIKDYVFDWDKLLSFEGNTAPYLQNAYVRICAIFRKGQITPDQFNEAPIILVESDERLLGLKILQFPDLLYSIAEDLSLHRLCDYLHDLAATYHRFYEHCPILSIPDNTLKQSRLQLCHLTARTLHLGLHLLGISTLEQM